MSGALCLHDVLQQYNCDLALISEHKLLPHNLGFMNCLHNDYVSISCSDRTLDSYSMLRCGKGGVSIMFKKTLASRVEAINTDSDRIIGIKLIGYGMKPYYVFAVYMPSNNYINDYRDELNQVQAIYTHYSEAGHVILGGDWNASILEQQHINLSKSRELRYFVNGNNIQAINTLPLCDGPNFTYLPAESMIDYVLTDEVTANLVLSCKIIDDGGCPSTSDHLPILCCIATENTIIPQSINQSKWIAWHKAKDDQILKYQTVLSNLLQDLMDWTIDSNTDINNYESHLVNSIHQAAKDSLPFKSPNAHTKPYWNDSVKQLHKRERHERIAWVKAGRPRDRNNDLYVNYKYAKEQFRIAQRSASEEYMNRSIAEIQNAAECDLRLFWKLVKKNRRSSSTSNIQLLEDNQVLSSTDLVLNAFEKFYKNLCSVKHNPEFDESFRRQIENEFDELKANSSHNFDQLSNAEITVEELNSIVSKLKKLKAPGWDGIQNEHIIYGGDVLKKVLLKLMNSVMTLESVPDSWKKGLIVPIYKGQRKSRSDINNYRPVTLLTVSYKIYERILQNRIFALLKQNNISFPNPQQQGFQKHLSCVSTVFCLQETIQYNMDQGSSTYVAFLDIKKAFDTVWHHALLVKLNKLGICGKIWRIICQLYENMMSAVTINGQRSKWFCIEQGVRQGGVMSTFLYLVYNNDLLVELENSNKGCKIGDIDCSCLSYVDDGAAAANSPRNLQILVNIAYRHACRYHYELHADKSCVVVYGKNQRTSSQPVRIYIGDKMIPQKQSTVHLGVRQDSNRSLSARVREACDKGRSAFYSMSDLGVRPCGLNPKTSVDLYKKVVIPTVLYGCEVWNNLKHKNIDELNKFQRMIAKKIQGFHPYVRTDMCESMLGLIRLQAEIDRRKLLFLRSLCEMPHRSVPSRIFQFKLFMYLDHGIDNGFIADIFAVLTRYNLVDYVTKYVQALQFPGKYAWKRIVNRAIFNYERNLWQERINTDIDFIRFKHLQLTIAPATIYIEDTLMKDRATTMFLAKLWVMKPSVVRTCHLCGCAKQDILNHIVGDCRQTRETINYFFLYIRLHLGDNIANELTSATVNDLLVKLLGRTFACNLNEDDMACLRVVSLQLLKFLTTGLRLY